MLLRPDASPLAPITQAGLHPAAVGSQQSNQDPEVLQKEKNKTLGGDKVICLRQQCLGIRKVQPAAPIRIAALPGLLRTNKLCFVSTLIALLMSIPKHACNACLTPADRIQ